MKIPEASRQMLLGLLSDVKQAEGHYNLAVSATFAALNIEPETVTHIDLDKGEVTLKEPADGN